MRRPSLAVSVASLVFAACGSSDPAPAGAATGVGGASGGNAGASGSALGGSGGKGNAGATVASGGGGTAGKAGAAGTTGKGGGGGAGNGAGGSGGGAGSGAGSGAGGAASGGMGGAVGAPCGSAESFLPAWLTGFVPTQVIHVAPDGDDTHDGTTAQTALKTTKAAFAKLAPGVRLDFHKGTYGCDGALVEAKTGTAALPMLIRSADGPRAARFDCAGGGGFLFDLARYLAVDGIELANVGQGHGLQIASGSPFDPQSLSHDLVIAHSFIHHSALANIKASQSRGITLVGNEFAFASPMRQMVEFVAVDQVTIAGNDGHDAAQFDEIKGGSKDSIIYGNYVHDTAGGILVGGDCTGFQFLIDPTVDYEATNLRVWDNVLANVGSEAFRVVGCKGCTIANNTFWSAGKTTAAIRYLSEGFGAPDGTGNCDYKPAPSADVTVVNNLFASLGGFAYMIPASQPNGLTLHHNAWFAGAGVDVAAIGSDVAFKGEPASLYGIDPLLVAPPKDLSPTAASPLVGKGAAVPFATGNRLGACWAGAPDIGAL